MVFSRQSAGIEIGVSGISGALLRGSVRTPHLERVALSPCAPGCLRISLREPNVLEPERFVESLRNTHNLLLAGTPRVMVSLPDAVSKIMLLDVEERFKSRAEGLDIIRWKLKKNLPFDVADAHVDYQQLQHRENGSLELLVAAVSRPVIQQYEDLILEAGLTPVAIDTTLFSMHRLFEPHLEASEACCLVYAYKKMLGIVLYRNGMPEFMRVKELTGSGVLDHRVFMELKTTLLAIRDRLADAPLTHLFYTVPSVDAAAFREILAEVAGVVPTLLEVTTMVATSTSATGDQSALFGMSGAIGAALRGL